MGVRRRADRVVLASVRELAAAGYAPHALFRELHPLLRSALGFDAGCWHESDPVTGALTSTVADGLDPAGFPQAIRLELWSDDATTFTNIRRAGRRVETMFHATTGTPHSSVRYRDLLSPFGYADELRVTFDVNGGRWGAAAFMRASGPFPADAVRLADLAARHIGAALREHATPRTDPIAPAVFVLGAADTVVSVTQAAEELMPRFPDDPGALPIALVTAAERARRGVAAPVLMRTRDGSWLSVTASRLGPVDGGQVAVVVTAASPTERVPLSLLSRGLSVREQEVALQVVRGRSTKEIAGLLHLSAVTVQDHLRSIFTKTGVRNRRELVALLVVPGMADG